MFQSNRLGSAEKERNAVFGVGIGIRHSKWAMLSAGLWFREAFLQYASAATKPYHSRLPQA